MKKTIIIKFFVMLLLVVMTFIFRESLLRSIDLVILLENRFSAYYDCINSLHFEDKYLFVSPLEENNCLINAINNRIYNNFSVISEDDGSIVINGVSNYDTPQILGVSPSRFKLEDGRYFFSDDASNNECYMYIEGRRREGGGADILAQLPEKNEFIANSQEYENYYVGIVILPGEKMDDKHFFPQLVKEETISYREKKKFVGCAKAKNLISENVLHYQMYYIELDKLEKLSRKECKMLLRYINPEGTNDCSWISISTMDGYGIQFTEERIIYGKMDEIGNIYDQKIELDDLYVNFL